MNTIPITPYGFRVLSDKKKILTKDLKSAQKHADIKAAIFERDLKELEELLAKSEVIEFNESRAASVELGTKVTLEDLKSGDKREYTIMPRQAANPLKGVISIDSPLAQKMMGFKLGNTFKIKNIDGSETSYKIKNIE